MSDQRRPEVTTGALIFDPEGRLFLMMSHKWPGKWVIPGGHVDLGERIEDAVVREVKEETNLDVRDVEFMCFQEFIYGDGFWKKRHFVFFDFACRTDSTHVVLNEEAEEYAWVSLDEIDRLPVEPFTRNVIREYLRKKGAPGRRQAMNDIPDNFSIRPFVEQDEAAVVELWRGVFSQDPPWNEPAEVVRKKLAVQRDLFLVGETGGEIVAAVIGGYDGFRGWVYHLAVAPGQRRKGLGRAMMAEVERRLLAYGCPKINLQVRAWNTDVVEFYKRLGYKLEEHTSMGKLLG